MINFAIMLLDIGLYVLDTWFYLVVGWIGVVGKEDTNTTQTWQT